MSEKIKLGELGEVVSGSTPKTNIKDYWDGEILWITPAEIQEDDYYIADTQRKITNLAVEKTNLKLLPKGTVLLSSRAPIGKVAICDNDMYCNQGFKNIICSDRLENRYVYYFLKYNVEYIKSLGRGATFKEISKGIVENLEIPYIEKKEQIEIANKLDKITEILKIKKQQIKQFDEIIKSQFVEMFENEKYPKRSLIDVCEELFAGGDVNKEHTSKERTDKYKYPIYTNGEKLDGLYGYTDIVRVNKEAVTISGRGTIGFSCIRKEPFYPAVRLIVAVPNKNIIDTIFLRQFIENKNYGGQGASIPQLTVPMIKNELIPIPPIELQNQFADIVKQIDKQKFEIENSLKEMLELYEALMERYFG